MHGAIRCIIYDFILVVLERLVTVITLSCTVADILRFYAVYAQRNHFRCDSSNYRPRKLIILADMHESENRAHAMSSVFRGFEQLN